MATKYLNPEFTQEPSVGMTAAEKAAAEAKAKPKPKAPKKAEPAPPKGQKVPGTNTYHVDEPTTFKKGGVTRGDGCVRKGHTKGRNV